MKPRRIGRIRQWGFRPRVGLVPDSASIRTRQ